MYPREMYSTSVVEVVTSPALVAHQEEWGQKG